MPVQQNINREVLAFFSDTDIQIYKNLQEAANDTLLDTKKIITAINLKEPLCNIIFKWSKQLGTGKHPNKFAKPILQFDKLGKLVAEFNSAYEAYIKTGIGNINKCLNGKLKTAGGFIWKYKD